jgi:hypothetical protein
MDLALQTQTTMQSDMSAAVEGYASAPVDATTDGSFVKAILQANQGVALWLQVEALQIETAGRLTTSTGTDVDTFVAQFGQARLAAVAASGTVTLSRFAAVTSATVPIGVLIRTGDGSLSYAVGIDPLNSLYSASAGGYVVPVGTVSVNVPVVCTTPGIVGNVITGAVSLLGSIAGINEATNAAPMTGGLDVESDDALKKRFADFIASLERATVTAVDEAIESVQQGIAYDVVENIDEAGAYRLGHFVVTAAQADGTLPPELESAIYLAVDRVRPVCSTFSVQPPAITWVDVFMTITAEGTDKASLIGPVQTAIATYINGLTVGQIMPYARLAVLTFNASSLISNIGNILLNGGVADVQPPKNGICKLRTITVN